MNLYTQRKAATSNLIKIASTGITDFRICWNLPQQLYENLKFRIAKLADVIKCLDDVINISTPSAYGLIATVNKGERMNYLVYMSIKRWGENNIKLKQNLQPLQKKTSFLCIFASTTSLTLAD